MDVITEIETLYNDYLSTMHRLDVEHKSSLRGAFGNILGFGPRPATDSCNDRFSDGLLACISRFVDTAPAPEDALRVARYVLEQGKCRKNTGPAALMLEAVHGYIIPVVELLTPEHTQMLLLWYQDAYPQRTLLPVQKQLVQALKAKKNAQ